MAERVDLIRARTMAPLSITLFLVAAGAFVPEVARAQVETLITINTLAENEAGGCYVGNVASDATLFIRAEPGLSGCDPSDPFDDFCLARREFASDGANGRSVSFGDMALTRPTVTGDGSFTLFVRNLDLCLMATDQLQQDICYDLPGPNGFFVNAIGVEPRGQLLGVVPRDLSNINVPVNALQVFALGPFPGITLLATYPFLDPLIFPETVDLMSNGEWILFDASDSQLPGGTWALYLLNRNTGELRTLAPAIAGYQLRNPVFGQTSDDVIAFDAVSTTGGDSAVLTANLLTGDVRKIADIATPGGVPSFNGDDTKIVFNREDPGVFSTVSLRERALAGDRLTPIGAEAPHLSNGGFATIYRRGAFDDTAVPFPEPAIAGGLAIAMTMLLGLRRSRDGSRGHASQPTGD